MGVYSKHRHATKQNGYSHHSGNGATSISKFIAVALFLLILLSTAASFAWAGADFGGAFQKTEHRLEKGVFLVATDNLKYSSFRETVVLVTHSSTRGATGIAINRPSEISLHDAFPEIKQFKKRDDELFLGGPVLSNRVFVLMMTERPHAGMHPIGKNLFFTTGLNAIAHGIDNLKPGEHTRAYAGYAGWAPGQLEAEIERGDWRIIAHDPSIIFDSNTKNVWYRLNERLSGHWI